MMKTQRAARGKRAGGDNKPMLKFLGGRNMAIPLWYYLLAGVYCNHVVGGPGSVANRTAFAKPRIGVDDGVCHGRNVEMASRASRRRGPSRAQEARWINDIVFPDREHRFGTVDVAHGAVGRVAGRAVEHRRVTDIAEIIVASAVPNDHEAQAGCRQLVSSVD